ncbi:MAG: hypothetical protein Q7U51_13175 [Methanoregula sp.]|nr:hypothetical protein [Methanoregula sp.]
MLRNIKGGSFTVICTILLILLAAMTFSSGCIKYLPTSNAGDTVVPPRSQESALTNTSSPMAKVPHMVSPVVSSPVKVTTPADYFRVNEIDPKPYITPDPYALPYRDHGNWTIGEQNRVQKVPQFTKKVVLRSNSTAFLINVTKGPLVVDLTYSPRFPNPDKTSTKGTNSFVFSNAEVIVFDEISNATVAKEGYGGIYSTDLHKKITVYREGPYVIAIRGNFIDVTMVIITGSAQKPVTTVPTSASENDERKGTAVPPGFPENPGNADGIFR